MGKESASVLASSKVKKKASSLANQRTLHLQVVEGYGLPNKKDSFRPYCVLCLNLDKKTKYKTTKPKTKDAHPVWYNQTIWSLTEKEIEQIQHLELYVLVKSKKSVRSEVFGKFKVFGRDLLSTHEFVDRWFELHTDYVGEAGKTAKVEDERHPQVRLQMQYILPGMKWPVFEALDMSNREYADSDDNSESDESDDEDNDREDASDGDGDRKKNTGIAMTFLSRLKKRNLLSNSEQAASADSLFGESGSRLATASVSGVSSDAPERLERARVRWTANNIVVTSVNVAYLKSKCECADRKLEELSEKHRAAAEESELSRADAESSSRRKIALLEEKLKNAERDSSHARALAEHWQQASEQSAMDVRTESQSAMESLERKHGIMLDQAQSEIRTAVQQRKRSDTAAKKWEETAKKLGEELDLAVQELTATRLDHTEEIQRLRDDYEVQLSQMRLELNKVNVSLSKLRREKQDECDRLRNNLDISQEDADAARGELAEMKSEMRDRRSRDKEVAEQLEYRERRIEKLEKENHALSEEVEALIERVKELEGKARSDEMMLLREAREAREAARKAEERRAEEERSGMDEQAQREARKARARSQQLLEDREEEERLARRRAFELALERQAAGVMRGRIFKNT